MRSLPILGPITIGLLCSFSVPSQATIVGDIQGCYSCQNTGNSSVDAALTANPSVASDGLLLAFANTSGAAITNATFSVSTTSYTDSFNVGTIAANTTFILLPGLSDDGGAHPIGSLFAHTGITMDTSDGDGGLTGTSAFSFTGNEGALNVTSGTFTPLSVGLSPWRAPVGGGSTDFVGIDGNGDPGCTNCFFGPLADLTVPDVGAVPEPSTWAMMILGFAGVGFMAYRRKANPILTAA